MVKLLIISDDFTGALDTGAQFAKRGIKTRVIQTLDTLRVKEDSKTQVLSLNAETRHLNAEKAYDIVYEIVKQAKNAGISYIFKKTDSALRGNIGSELDALLTASGEQVLPFIPAYPKMRRITKQGIHYLGNMPIHLTDFGKDPFNPIRCSSVAGIIGEQSERKVCVSPADGLEGEISDEAGDKRIVVVDAETDMQMKTAAEQVVKSGCRIMAGCAGLASILPDVINFKSTGVEAPVLYKDLLIVCGSIHPITARQLQNAYMHGFVRIHLTEEQKFEKSYFESVRGYAFLKHISELCRNPKPVMIDTIGSVDRKEGAYSEEVRQLISHNLGCMINGLLKQGLKRTLLVTGGDTLQGFIRQLGNVELEPISEFIEGTALFYLYKDKQRIPILSKSGGFGEETIFVQIDQMLKEEERMEGAFK